ncbi:MAG: glycosyltransferase family 2 protein [Crocinitomicaceae bacterium]|jgi:glycosyltransferase involved in cell wall biosynthesis|nr:glycosyltransferase family 2 protein [Crocinitomicaceae bacterium]
MPLSLPKIVVVIPAFNEEKSIAKVIADIPKDWVSDTIVVNNNSTDRTEQVAHEAGAIVLSEKRKGYGWACLTGIAKAEELKAEIIVFMDGDYSDYPQELPLVVGPILDQDMDMVIGSRALGKKEKGSLTPQQVFGNWLATQLIRLFYSAKFTDLGPFRAMKMSSLMALNMQDKTYGWTIEMQIKAVKHKMKFTEVAVNYKKRIGVSKVSGTVKGTILAGIKIISAVFKYL